MQFYDSTKKTQNSTTLKAPRLTLGGEDKVKAAGKLLIKGKDYVMEDGDM